MLDVGIAKGLANFGVVVLLFIGVVVWLLTKAKRRMTGGE